jgi:hypothetical protein
MSVLDALTDVLAIGLPEFAGEFVTDALVRVGRGRWERVASGNRIRAEEAVRFLRRNEVAAWIRPANGSVYEVIVRTEHAEIARGLLNAPSAGWRPV